MKRTMKFDRDAVLNFIVCIGAAVVILGALTKLIHHRFADTMLTIGLSTEALIFVIYAFLPPEKEQKVKIKVQENFGQTVDTKPIERFNELVEKVFKGA
jgi:gliding motility-associated protein GldL